MNLLWLKLNSSLSHLQDSVFAEFSVLKISAKLKTTGEISELSFIVKTPPKSEGCGDFVSQVKAFYKEPLVYNGLLKDISAHISGKLGPDCFLSQPEKCIVLDNVFNLGYRIKDIRKEFNIHYCKIVLEALAKLHAAL